MCGCPCLSLWFCLWKKAGCKRPVFCWSLIFFFFFFKWCQKGNSVFMARQISSSWQVYSHYVAVRSRCGAIVEPRARVPMHQREPISLLVSPSKATLHLQTPAGQNKVSYLWSSQQCADARENDNWMPGFAAERYDSPSLYVTPEPTARWCLDYCHNPIRRNWNWYIRGKVCFIMTSLSVLMCF